MTHKHQIMTLNLLTYQRNIVTTKTAVTSKKTGSSEILDFMVSAYLQPKFKLKIFLHHNKIGNQN